MSALHPSSRLSGLPGYGSGRAADGEVFRHRLGSNECAEPPAPGVLEAANTALRFANRYPDLRGETLAAALAARFDLTQEEVAVAAGSVVLLEQLIRAYCDPGDEIVTPWRSYEAYPIIARMAGATLSGVSLDAEHRMDAGAMLAAIGPRTRAVLLCNPNNPTGTALTSAALDKLIEAMPDDILVIVDEAYAEFDADASHAASARRARRGNVAVLRTFSKAWGLAGLRVGYCLADSAIIAAVHAVQPPFPLPSAAIAAAVAAVEDGGGLQARVAQTVGQRRILSDALRAIGLPVARSAANFIWLPVGDGAEALAEHLRAQSIAVRLFPGEGVRITIGTQDDTDAVIAALDSERNDT